MKAGQGDLRTIAKGLIPAGFNAATLTPEGRDEVREAIDVILKLSDNRNAKLGLALEQLDRAAAEIERLRGDMRDACDLLAERTRGSAARSPGHNARLRLEASLNHAE